MERTRREATAVLIAAAAAALTPSRAEAETPVAANLAPRATPEPQPATPPPPEGSVAGGKDRFEHLTAPVMINGKGPFPFLVDTGASISCISRPLAESLGMPIQEKRRVHTIAGVQEAPMALIDELRLGVRRERRVAALAIHIEEEGIEGVLAVDRLRNQRLTLDFANNNLTFTDSRVEQTERGKVVVPARRRLGQLTIVDADLGPSRISAMVDSGSQASLCNTALLNLIDRKQAMPTEHQLIYLISVTGERYSGELVYLPFLRLGGLQLGNVPVVHSDTHAFTIWGFADTPALLLGMDLLRQFRAVSLDFGRSQVRFDLTDAEIANS
jgi:predicted aspartyl protease